MSIKLKIYLLAILVCLINSKNANALTAGNGLDISNGSIDVNSSKTSFLSSDTSLSCSSSLGKLIIDTSAGTLAWCDGSGAHQSAFGDDDGKALSGDTATSFFSSGTIEASRLGTGTPSSSNFLRGDGAWSTAVSSILPNYPGSSAVSSNQIKFYGANGVIVLSGDLISAADPTVAFGVLSDDTGFLQSSLASGCTGGEAGLESPTIAYCDSTTRRNTALGNTSGNALTGDNATAFFSAGSIEASVGGTGQTGYTAGDILYASGTNALSKLAKPASGTKYLQGGTTPSWAQVDLSSGVTSTLALASITDDASTGKYITSGGSGGDPTWAQVDLASGVTGVLPLAKITDDATANKCLISGGSGGDPSWTTCTTAADVTAVGDCTSGACFTGTTGNTMTFKGATSGTIAVKPADTAGTNTITLPAETGTACTTGSVCSGYEATLGTATDSSLDNSSTSGGVANRVIVLSLADYDNTGKNTIIWWTIEFEGSGGARDFRCQVYLEGSAVGIEWFRDSVASGVNQSIAATYVDTVSAANRTADLRCYTAASAGNFTNGTMTRLTF